MRTPAARRPHHRGPLSPRWQRPPLSPPAPREQQEREHRRERYAVHSHAASPTQQPGCGFPDGGARIVSTGHRALTLRLMGATAPLTMETPTARTSIWAT